MVPPKSMITYLTRTGSHRKLQEGDEAGAPSLTERWHTL